MGEVGVSTPLQASLSVSRVLCSLPRLGFSPLSCEFANIHLNKCNLREALPDAPNRATAVTTLVWSTVQTY